MREIAGFIIGLVLAALAGCTVLPPVDAVLNDYPKGSPEQEAAHFLLDNLPQADRWTITARDLKENIDYAFLARTETTWAQAVPPDIFLHYVLPHRLINEPFSPWRKKFHNALKPIVQRSKSTLEAAIRVNLWCVNRVEYHPSSGWLLAPTDTLKIGFGRCEELAILFAAAARSVGIPVRGCWVPAWRHTDDNHVWMEVWYNGEWIPLEAASPVVDQNRNWFLAPARTAPAVYSPIYGHLGHPDTPVYRCGPGYTMLNLTGRYADTSEFAVRCLDMTGKPVKRQQVFLWTYNSSVPTMVARHHTDTHGMARFLLGQGSYIASTGDGKIATAAVVSSDAPTTLQLGRGLPDQWTWTLQRPEVKAALHRYPSLSADVANTLGRLASQAMTNLKSRKSAVASQLATLARTEPDMPQATLSAIQIPWASSLRLIQEYLSLSSTDRRRVDLVIPQLGPKDLALVSLGPLSQWSARQKMCMEGAGPTSRADACAPRMGWEPFSLPGSELEQIATSFRRPSRKETVVAIMDAFAPRPNRRKQSPFATPLSPMLTSRHPQDASRLDHLVLCASLMRNLSIPARLSALRETIVYFNGNGFIPASREMDGVTPSPKALRCAEAPGHSMVRLGPSGVFDQIHLLKNNPLNLGPGILLRVRLSRQSTTSPSGEFSR